jgi:putative ABC transport system permease protein
VSQRTTEFGIRAALGAQPGQVRALVVGQGLRLAGVGVVLGIAGSLLATRALASLLFGVTPHDPLTFVVAAAVVAVVAAAASYAPARRATKVDLVTALRGE